jgi:hypothetical protein
LVVDLIEAGQLICGLLAPQRVHRRGLGNSIQQAALNGRIP